MKTGSDKVTNRRTAPGDVRYWRRYELKLKLSLNERTVKPTCLLEIMRAGSEGVVGGFVEIGVTTVRRAPIHGPVHNDTSNELLYA